MEKDVEISKHAWMQMAERGATELEVHKAIRQGQKEPALLGRVMYRKNFQFDGSWRERRYRIKQVAPVVADEGDELVVVTVYVYYF
ncbi:MAG: hypothetical protein ACOC7P_00150 [Chloroflexota bacterium]